ncbi:unnamed protein product [Ectocarpus sp. 12 AP-2014]
MATFMHEHGITCGVARRICLLLLMMMLNIATNDLRRLLTRQDEGWLTAFEGALFDDRDGDDEKRKEERLREATAFAARRREMGWRLTHDELYNSSETARG